MWLHYPATCTCPACCPEKWAMNRYYAEHPEAWVAARTVKETPMQRCVNCNRELANGVTEAYDARKATCADWGEKCQKGGAAAPPHDAATTRLRGLEEIYATAKAKEDRVETAEDLTAARAAHMAVLEATAERVAAGDGALSDAEEQRVADKARRKASK